MQRYRDEETLEYRGMAAMAAALVCCAVGLVAAAIMLTTGDRFEFRPPPTEISRRDDELVRSFDALESMAAKRTASAPQTTGSSTARAKEGAKRRIVMRLKSPWCTGALRNQSFYRCRTQSW